VRWLFPESEIKIETPCLDCGEPIVVRFEQCRLEEVDPPSSVGYMMSPFTKWRDGSTAFN
jgi:hypothetical protein